MRDGIFDKHDIVEGVIGLLDGITVSGAENVNRLSQTFQMLYALRKGLKDEDGAKDKIIELLKVQLKRATEPHPQDEEEVVGGEHYDLKFGGVDNGKD